MGEMARSPSDAFGNSFTRYGRQAILEVVEQMGFAALTDEALIELAIKHWQYRQKILGDWCRVLVTVRQQCTDVNPPNVHAEPSQRIRIVHAMLSHISGDPVHAEDAMKTRRFLIVVLFVFTSAPLVWANDQAASVDSLKKRAAQGLARAQTSLGTMYAEGQGVPQDDAEAL